MPRYHLNIRNGTGYVADEEGRELADVEAARIEAIHGIRSIISEEILQEGRIDLKGCVEVTDGDGRLVTVVAFADAVRLDP